MATNFLHEVKNNNGKFPREILLKAIEKMDEIIPELLEILEYTLKNAENLAEEEDYIGHIYALYLLAQFREQSAFPIICSLLNMPYEILDKLLGDMITEGMPSILASVFNGDVKLLKSIIENEEIDEFIRSSALESLVTLVAQGIITRDEVVSYLQNLFHGGLKREYSYVWDALVGCNYHIYPEETIKDIELAYDDDLVDPLSISFGEIKEQLGKSKQSVLDELLEDQRYQLIDDTIRELEYWACFEQEGNKGEPELYHLENSNLEQESIQKVRTELYRSEHKVGRNDPCPCGSGKKYKKCCGINQ